VSLVFCKPGTLVNPRLWLPEEPFDYSWGSFGCNQLRCGRCGQAVASRVIEQHGRHYECACQARDEYGVHPLGADAGQDRAFETAWHCGGHPRLALPTVLDGIPVAASGPEVAAVQRGFTDPPFTAPGFSSAAFWVTRLFRLMSTEEHKARVGNAVATYLTSEDAALLQRALDFYYLAPEAAGAEQLAALAVRDRVVLRGFPASGNASASLYDRLLASIEARLMLEKDGGGTVDEPALEVARSALLRGEAEEELVYAVAQHDAAWLAASAAAIVRAKPTALDYVLTAFEDLPEAHRDHGLAVLRQLDKKADAAVRRWARENGVSLK
jgi:hypothetical protein